jgi:hypothetical protein
LGAPDAHFTLLTFANRGAIFNVNNLKQL